MPGFRFCTTYPQRNARPDRAYARTVNLPPKMEGLT